jgi:hypothetical protein
LEVKTKTNEGCCSIEKFESKTESFRNNMLWNSFLMFFYEASLEVSMSLIVGYNYIQEYDSDPES